MILAISWGSLAKRLKLAVKVILLIIIIFYILPKLLSLFWQANDQELKLREQRMLEKPLRVSAQIIDNS
ncbi:hypothetical protein SDC9_112944 [bioreactor metagenome]|uniref:Uncharacterized protein n=1 Tax=bioreactor metagenome TaxID=1076179 RepID=A0A645BKP7_9ZZZZ